jgi:hypothetical protein
MCGCQELVLNPIRSFFFDGSGAEVLVHPVEMAATGVAKLADIPGSPAFAAFGSFSLVDYLFTSSVWQARE